MRKIHYSEVILAKVLLIILILWTAALLDEGTSSPPSFDYIHSDFLWDGKQVQSPQYMERWEAEKDINQLIYALEKAYIGYFFLTESVEEAIEELKGIKLNEKVKVEKFYEQLEIIFEKIPDRHATVHLVGTKKEKKSYPSHNSNTTDHPWLVELRQEGNHQVLLIAITSFPPFSSALWEGFLDIVKEKLPQCSSVILDLRGNRGGDDRMGRQLAALFYGSEKWPYPVSKILRYHQCETYIMRANAIKLTIKKLQGQGTETDQLEQDYQDLIQKASHLADQESDDSYVTHICVTNPLPDAILPIPIFVLMDRACGSSGENMVDFLEQHPYAVTIGEPTHGAIHFGNRGLFFLRHSKIIITLGTQFKEYHDGRMLEGIGITPTYQVPSEEAYEAALAQLSNS